MNKVHIILLIIIFFQSFIIISTMDDLKNIKEEKEILNSMTEEMKQRIKENEHDIGRIESELNSTSEFLSNCLEDKLDYRRRLISCEENKPNFLYKAGRVAQSNEWEANVYDCTQFSQDLVKELNSIGYEARTVHGYWYNDYEENMGWICIDDEFDCRHDFVCLGGEFDYSMCIEATEGTVITPEQLKGEYFITGEGIW